MKPIPILLTLLAIVHLVPACAGIMPSQISRLYGVSLDDKVFVTLLQHRAILLGLVGLGFVVAIGIESLRWPALIGGVISMLTFVIIAAMHGQIGGPLHKIIVVDLAALILAALTAFFLFRK